MFAKGFSAVKSMFKPLSTSSAANTTRASATMNRVAKPLAFRKDGSPVTSDWGLRQGMKSGTIKGYGSIL